MQNELVKVYDHLQIVENNGLESLVSMFIKIGKKIDHKLISDLISPYSF